MMVHCTPEGHEVGSIPVYEVVDNISGCPTKEYEEDNGKDQDTGEYRGAISVGGIYARCHNVEAGDRQHKKA